MPKLLSVSCPTPAIAGPRQLLVLAMLGAFCLGAPHAVAQAVSAHAATASYAIAAGPLLESLNLFASQARVNLSFTPQQVSGLHSPGLQGRHMLQAGLEQLLAGTGLVAEKTPAGYVLARSKPSDPAVRGNAVPAADMGRGAGETVLATTEVRALSEQPKEDAYRTAASVSVLSREDIERSRGSSVGDMFQGLPGVLVGENRNSGGLDVNIRGMQGQGRVPVLLDGSRQETTVYRGYAGVSSRSYIDPDLLAVVQVDKGPTMNAAGTGAVGGLVSMRTLSADDIVRPGQTFGLRMRASALGNNSGSVPAPGTASGLNVGSPSGGQPVFRKDCAVPEICGGAYAMPASFGADSGLDRPGALQPQSWAGSIALARRWQSLDLVAAYAQRSQGNYYAGTHGPVPSVDMSDERKLPFYTEVRPVLHGATRFRAGERVANSNYESKSALLKTRLYLPQGQELELGLQRYRSRYGELMPSQLIWLGQVRQTANSTVTAKTYTARYQWSPEGSQVVDLRVNLWRTHTDSLNRNYAGSDGASDVVMGYPSMAEQYRRTGVDASNTMRFGGGWGALKLDYGLAAQWESLQSPDAQHLPEWLSNAHHGKREEFSAFSALQWKPWDTVTLDAGLRHTRFSSRDERACAGRVHACDPRESDNRQSGTAPLASVGWELRPGLQLYGRYAQALRMPSLFESTLGFSTQFSPDVRLRPENARNKEVGVNVIRDGWLTSKDQLRLKAAYFQNHTKNYLTRTLPNLWEQGAQNNIFTMRNIHSASFEGLELSGSYDNGGFFTEFGGTRYTHVETCHEGSWRRENCTNYGIASSYINNMIPPKWHATVTLGARLMERRLTLGTRATLMGQRTPVPRFNDQGVSGVLAPPVPWHAYRVFDLFASYRVNQAVQVDFNIDNLTDRYYIDALSLGLVPAPGRTARLSVTVNF